MSFRSLFVLAAWTFFAELLSHAASPVIFSVSPRAIIPGQKTILTLKGSNLDGVTHLWTYFNARTRRITNSDSGASFEVLYQGGLYPSGVWGIQAYGPEGVSDFALVMIDPFTTVKQSETNNSFTSAQPLTPGFAVDGAFNSEKVDYYRFTAKAGEEFSIEALAHRFGSQADPVLQILDATGRELVFCDDDDSVWRDARFRFRAPLNGEYTIAAHDVGYAGGSGYPYRLRIGDFPLVAVPFPLGDLTEAGAGVDLGAFRTNASPASPDARTWYNTIPALLEREPNESSEKAQEFSPPVIINGRFQSGEDRDLFRFRVSRDQRITFQRQSRSLGSPCDVVLRVLKPTGELLAETDGTSPDEVLLTYEFQTEGTYLLEASDLTGTAPTHAPYRIQVRSAAPEFRLSTETNRLEIAPDGSAKLKVTCERLGYEDEIRLEAPNVLFEQNLIPAKKKEAEITVKLPPNAQDYFHIRLTGKGTNGFTAAATTKPALRKTFPLMLVPPNELDGLIAIARKTK